MKQRVGPKKLRRYARDTGLPVVAACVRGGWGHMVLLTLEDGRLASYFPNREGEVVLWNKDGSPPEEPKPWAIVADFKGRL